MKNKIVVKNGKIEEVSMEEFNKLKEVEGRREKKVDYEKLIEKLDGRCLSVKMIGEEMKMCSDGKKKKVYYSEVLGMIGRMEESGRMKFSRGQGDVIIYKCEDIRKK